MRMLASLIVAVLLLSPASSQAAAESNVKCRMTFTMKGWSAFYKTASGTGTIKCSNGQSLKVKLSAKGGGLTVGKSSIDKGAGEFSRVGRVEELLGAYASAEAHAGA